MCVLYSQQSAPRKLDLAAWGTQFASDDAYPDLAGESLSSFITEIRTWKLDQKCLPGIQNLHVQLRINKILCKIKRDALRVSDQATENRVELLTYFKYELVKHHVGEFPTPEIAIVFGRVESFLGVQIDIPDWFIPPYELKSKIRCSQAPTTRAESTNQSWGSSRTWAMQVHMDEENTQTRFIKDMTRWYTLKHPHVEQLLGACHVGKRYFLSRECGNIEVVSSALTDTSDDWFKKTKKPSVHRMHPMTWRTLYNAALGLQFLHDRGITHGDVRGNVVIPDGNVVKLRGFFWRRKRGPKVAGANRGAHANQSPFAVDVCAFGWCILDVVNGPQYLEYNAKRTSWEAATSPKWELDAPTSSRKFSSAQWSFVHSLVHQHPNGRILTITDVVRQLKSFALDEKYGPLSRDDSDSTTQSRTPPSIEFLTRALLDSTRSKLDDSAASFSGSWATNKQVGGRLSDIWIQLQSLKTNSKHRNEIWTRYHGILERFLGKVKASTRESSATVHLASSRMISESNYELNLELDQLCAPGKLSLVKRDHDWQDQWTHISECQFKSLSTRVRDQVNIDDNEERANLAFLQFERNQRRSRYTTEELRELNSTIKAISHDHHASIEVGEPPWLIPPYEIYFEEHSFQNGGFSLVYRGKWTDAEVVVKKLEPSKSAQIHLEFFNEVTIWYQLSHPNIIKLFGACHVKEYFFVCEYAANGQLDTYLKVQVNGYYQHRSETWHRLSDAAAGLKYLHDSSIVHGDLKCNNILVGTDGLAKLADFGLSSFNIDTDVAPKTGAVRWMAPEVLHNGSPSFASDVYSFGMCVIEAVSGQPPWQSALNVFVKRSVKNCKLPARPPRFQDDKQLQNTDKAWDLVEWMCSYEPGDRPSMEQVENDLSALAKNRNNQRRTSGVLASTARP